MPVQTQRLPQATTQHRYLSLIAVSDTLWPWWCALTLALLALGLSVYRQWQLRQRLSRSQQTSSQLQAVIIHEIRTPFSAIAELLDLVQSNPALPKSAREQLKAAQCSARTLLELLDDMLTQSKLELGKLALNPQAAHLPRLLHELGQSYTPLAQRKNLRLVISSDCPHPYLRFDVLRLRQILNNLLANAIKYTEQGQISLQLKTRPSGHGMARVEIQVSDSGIGMGRAALADLFSPFSASGEAARQRFGGNGLGLYLCQQLTGRMNGTIQAESLLGRGSTLRLMFEFPEAPAPVMAQNQQPNYRGMRALIADDDQANRMLLQHQLERYGMRVSGCNDGEQCLKQWMQTNGDILFFDMHMPKLDGAQLTRRIRRLERRFKKPRTVIVNISADQGQPFAESDIDASLSKPASRDALEQCLRQHLTLGRESAPASRLNLELLHQLSQGDRVFEHNLTHTLLQQNHQDLTQLLHAQHVGNRPLLARVLHHMKSGLRLFGHEDLNQRLLQLETLLESASTPQLEPQLSHFISEIDALNHELEQRCPGHQASSKS